MNLACLGTLARKQVQSSWLSGYSYRKSFTYSRASGAVENYQVKLVIGESGGVNLLSNAGFDSNTTGWDPYQCSLASVSGGQSGNCLQMTRTSGDFQHSRQKVTLVAGARYLLTAYVKSGTSGDEAVRLYANTSTTDPWDWYYYDSTTTSSEWQQMSLEFSPDEPGTEVNLSKQTATAGTMLFDTVVLQPAIHCNAHCLATFADLRFTKSDGTTELDYWIESVTGSTPNCLATVWVELDSVGTGATTFYMYYGKGDAVAGSDGDSTFPFFDDFPGSSLDTDKWTQGGDAAAVVSGGECVLDNDDIIYGKTAFGYGYEIRARSKADEQDIRFVGLGDSNDLEPSNYIAIHNSDSVANYDYDQFRLQLSKDGSYPVGANYNGAGDFRNTYYQYYIRRISGKVTAYQGDTLLATYTTSENLPTGDLAAIFAAWDSSKESALTIDWVFIRKYEETEPALGSWGEEES